MKKFCQSLISYRAGMISSHSLADQAKTAHRSLHDVKSCRVHGQVPCLVEDNLGEDVQLVVVSAQRDVDAQVMRSKLVCEAREIGIIGVLRQRIGDKVRKESRIEKCESNRQKLSR